MAPSHDGGWRRPLGTAAALLAVVLAGLLFALPRRAFVAPAASWAPAPHEVRGVFHIHTKRSDGTGTMDEVAAAAAADGLQFVIVTDHGDATREPEAPTYRSGVLCIDAVEISTTGGHYAALGLGAAAPYPLAGEPRDVVEDVRRLGGFGVITHPLSKKAALHWSGWDAQVDGFEWLNGDSVWRDAPTSRLAGAALSYGFRPGASLAWLFQRPDELSKWDSLNRSARLVGLAGTDAHARLGFREGPEPYQNPVYVKVPSYKVAFSVASLRVRLEDALRHDPRRDADAILSAIRLGHVHTIVDCLGTGGQFDFTAASNGVTAHEGDALPGADVVVVRVRGNPPPQGWLVLYRDGMQVHRVQGQELTYASNHAGTYRAEVWVPAVGRKDTWVPWVVGNPIVVGEPERPAPPPPVDATGPSFAVESGTAVWAVEKGTTSSGELTSDGGVGLGYRLAAQKAPAPYAALVANTVVDPRAIGVRFTGRAARPMRVSVQLRVPAPGDGLRWIRSIYLDQTPRDVLVPFAEMRPVAGAPLDPASRLADVRSLLFVVDTVNAKAGSTGAFVVADVRFVSPGPRSNAK